MKRARPLSPHLQIYKPQITSVLSILHRVMGVVLSVGMVVLVGWIFALTVWPTKPQCFDAFQTVFTSLFGRLVLMGFSFAFFYHLNNGIRHLVWDIGRGYDLRTMEKSGLAVVVATFFLTALLWSWILF